MTLNDIILRDMEICRREEEREAAARSLADYEKEINRRLRKRRMRKFGEIAAGIIFCVSIIAFMWLCCACSGYHWE